VDGDVESSTMYEAAGLYRQRHVRLGQDHPDQRPLPRVQGRSWADRIYWANPGTRRYLDERQSTATIGFRCAMTRVGSPVGLGDDKRRSKLSK
jgi:hypothetical protein